MYGQQITVPEQLKNNPSLFNNTGERFLLQNRIPLTLILEPYAHFNQNNTSSTTTNNSYTEFKVILGQDGILDSPTLLGANTFGQSVTYTISDIVPKNSSGTSLKVDRIYDVYIESITTFNVLPNTTKNTMAFILEINDWNIDNNANLTSVTKSIIIPNEVTTVNQTQTHKAKKLNYVTHLTPDTISTISGRISFLNGENIFEATPLSSNDHRISIELILIPRNKN
jgi:hypothetical protein